MLTDQTMDTIKSTIPLLESAGTAITDHFYQRLFTHNPELKNIFNMSNQQSGRQKTALFNAIAAYAKNIDNLPALKQAVERIANKHSSLNVQAAHYQVVGHHLIETLRELAADAFTPEVERAWTDAYGVLADVFIAREESIYASNAETQGGWRGERQFRLVEKRIESELVKSMVFEPVDGGKVIDFKPGQYIGIRLQREQFQHDQIRQYSLSSASNGDSYQISVKREIIDVPGVVSNYLHDGLRLGDLVDLYAPAGDFYFLDKQAPVCLLSAGVGLTPMLSILETLAKQQYQQPITYLHACESVEQHSFKKRVEQLAGQLNLEAHTWYKHEHPLERNVHHGLMDLSLIEQDLPLHHGDFYLCGPVPFMRFAKQQLITLGVEEARIHYEVFGPHDDF